MPKIQLITQDGSKMEFDLTIERATFGRADGNDIVIPDGSVSSRHGEILVKGDGIELVDLGSTNGTHHNGQRVERASVGPGESFKLGLVEGKVLGTPAPAAAAAPAAAPAPALPPKPGAPPPPGAKPGAPPPPSGAPRPGAPPPPSGAKPGAPPPPPGAKPGAPPPPTSGAKLPTPPATLPSAPPAAAPASAPSEAGAEDSGSSGESQAGAATATWSTAPSAPVIMAGLGATPCPVRQRKGFGAKLKEKDKVSSMLVMAGVVSLLICAGAAFMIHQMGG